MPSIADEVRSRKELSFMYEKTEEPLQTDDYIETHIKRDGGVSVKIHTFKLAQHILTNEIIHHDADLFRYFSHTEGVWKSDTEMYLSKKISEKLGEHTNINRVRETMNNIKLLTYQDGDSEEVFNANPFALTLSNGTYYFKNGNKPGRFEPCWSPYDFSTVKVNIAYNEKMKREGDTLPIKTYTFLSRILEKEEIEFIFEWLGFCMIKSYPFQRLLILHGSGGNGKSTLINFLCNILSQKNVSNLSLETIQNERFGRAHLYSKLLNGCADINDTFFRSTDMLKGLTGNDMIYAEYKGKDGFSFRNFAKLIFSANTLPSFKDGSEGMKRRLILLPMFKKPDSDGIEITAEEILNDQDEMSRILHHAIESIEKVMENADFTKNKDFSITEKMENALDDWLEQMDSVSCFVNESCNLIPSRSETVDKLYSEYKWYCEENGHKPMVKRTFSIRIVERFPSLERKRGTGGKRSLAGISLIQ